MKTPNSFKTWFLQCLATSKSEDGPDAIVILSIQCADDNKLIVSTSNAHLNSYEWPISTPTTLHGLVTHLEAEGYPVHNDV
jgi:predicted MarR family transcription regulator